MFSVIEITTMNSLIYVYCRSIVVEVAVFRATPHASTKVHIFSFIAGKKWTLANGIQRSSTHAVNRCPWMQNNKWSTCPVNIMGMCERIQTCCEVLQPGVGHYDLQP